MKFFLLVFSISFSATISASYYFQGAAGYAASSLGLSKQADIKNEFWCIKPEDGVNDFMLYASQNDADTIEFIFKNTAVNVIEINTSDKKFRRPLDWPYAVLYNKAIQKAEKDNAKKVIEILVQYGASLDCQASEKHHPGLDKKNFLQLAQINQDFKIAVKKGLINRKERLENLLKAKPQINRLASEPLKMVENWLEQLADPKDSSDEESNEEVVVVIQEEDDDTEGDNEKG